MRLPSLCFGLGFLLWIFSACVNGKLNWASDSSDPDDIPPTEQPQISGVVPGAGARGLLVSISGRDFSTGLTVTVGGVPCVPVTLQSSTQLTCRIGKHRSGSADIVLQNLQSAPTTLARSFVYLSFLYVSSASGGFINVFAFDEDTGALAQIPGSPFGTIPSSEDLSISPDGRFLYTLSNNGTELHRFRIDAEVGALTDQKTPAVPTSNAQSIVFTPDSAFMYYVSSSGNLVEGFAVDTNGGLTPVPGSPKAGLALPRDAAVSRDGRTLFTGKGSGGAFYLQKHLIDGGSGALTADGDSADAGAGTVGVICLHPFRDVVFGAGGASVVSWRIEGDGTLTAILSGAAVAADGVLDCAVSPDGNALYLLGDGANKFSLHAIAETGALSSLGAQVEAGGNVSRMVMSPGGKYLLVTDPGLSVVRKFAVGADGGLTLEASSVTTGSTPNRMEFN